MKFSIVIPVYNGAEYILQCLDSLICQTFQDWEAICIDDGSLDRSLEMLNEYAERDSRITVYSQLNMGVAKARDLGMHYMRGDYFLFIDIDDVLTPRALQTLYEKIVFEGAPDIVVGGVCVIAGNKIVKMRKTTFSLLDNITYLKSVLTGKEGWELWGKAYNRSLLFAPLTYPQGLRIGEDASVFVQLVSRAKKIVGCEDVIYNYIQYEGSVSHKKSLELAIETLNAALFIEEYFKGKNYYHEIRVELDTMWLLFYSNSTRRVFLKKSHPLMRLLKDHHFSASAFRLLPLHKAIYILIIYYFFSKK